jgi:acyl-CoA synthetase (AMP-forming)/AMP-acid ligase II
MSPSYAEVVDRLTGPGAPFEIGIEAVRGLPMKNFKRRERIAQWGAIPTLLHRLVHSPRVASYDLSSLRSISFGGAPTAPETIQKAREVLPIEPSFANAYLARFKVPEIVEFTHAPLPRNAAGKLQKNLLRASGPVPADGGRPA